MKFKNLLRLFAALWSIALLASACGGSDAEVVETPAAEQEEEAAPVEEEPAAPAEQAAEGEPIVIGMIADLTGPTSDVGVSYADGERAYVDFVNSNGGVNGRPIELLWQDYQYDVATAEQLYSQYVSEGAVAFMGWGTGDTEALRGAIAADQIPFMSASLSEALVDPAESPYNFVPASTYSEQLRVALRYIADQGGESNVVLFHHDSPFGTSPIEDGEKYIADNGLTINFSSTAMPGGATDYSGELAAASNPDYIVIQNVPSPASTLIRDIVGFGGDTQVICLNWCGNEVLVDLLGPDADGVVAVQPFLGPLSGVPGLDEISGHAGSVDDLSVGYIHGWTAMKTMITAIDTVAAAGDEVSGPNIAGALEAQTLSTGGLSADIVFSGSSHAGMAGAPLQIVTDGIWVPLADVITP